MMETIKKIFEKWGKKNNKTFLNSLNGFIAVLIVLFAIILTLLSNWESNCNNDVQIMLINKTQQYVEKQKILIDRTQDVAERVEYAITGDNDSRDARTRAISAAHKEYKSFIDSMEAYDRSIESKKNECIKLNNLTMIVTAVIITLALFQLCVSTKFFSRYLKDK